MMGCESEKYMERVKNMKNIISIMFMLFVASILYAGVGLAADISMQTGPEYDWWKSDEHERGYQFRMPIRIDAQQQSFSAFLVTSYAYSHFHESNGDDPSLSDITDTKVGCSYIGPDSLPFDILFGLDMNLPTGETDLDDDDLAIMMDADLISITSFGEGINVNPSIVIARQWDKWAAGLGAGYTWRGEYDFSSDIRNYDPGDIINTTGEVRYSFSPAWQARMFGEYAYYSREEADDSYSYKEGDLIILGLGLNYFRQSWDIGATVRGVFRGDEQLHVTATQDRDTYGDEWIADLSGRIMLSDKTTLISQLEYLRMDENGYASSSPYYIGNRDKVCLLAGLIRQLSQDFEAGFKVKGLLMDDDKGMYHMDEDRSFKGFSATASLTRKF
jgi:hypothetical protein